MVGSPTRTNSLPHRIDRAQLGAARSKNKLVRAVRLINFTVFRFMPFTSLGYRLSTTDKSQGDSCQELSKVELISLLTGQTLGFTCQDVDYHSMDG